VATIFSNFTYSAGRRFASTVVNKYWVTGFLISNHGVTTMYNMVSMIPIFVIRTQTLINSYK
jgi:hypothetical protein